jgi:hypothetical protein
LESENRVIGDDFASPVEIQPGVDHATPADWTWRAVATSQPNRATFHLTHSDVSRVLVDVLRLSDSPTDGQFVLSEEVPVIVMDSLDKYWAAESRTKLPLNGIRVPVEGDTIGDAKKALAADLAAQLRLLLLLNASHKGLAPQLQENLAYLNSIMNPAQGNQG